MLTLTKLENIMFYELEHKMSLNLERLFMGPRHLTVSPHQLRPYLTFSLSVGREALEQSLDGPGGQ